MSKVIGVDLGGTNLRVALIENGKVKKYIKKSTPKNKTDLLKELVKSISEVDSSDVCGIGVASPGPLENGVIKNPPNLPLRNFNLESFLHKKFNKKVVIENDAACVALAEAKLGVKKKNFFILTLGTGIGGGIIINGELYKGKGYAGEMGYIVLDNGKSFEDLWKELNSKKIFMKDLLKKKDRKSKKKVQDFCKYLGQGIGSLINVFDPEVVVLMGGIRESGNGFLKLIDASVRKYVLLPRKHPIVWSKINHPGVLGASLLIN